MKISFLSQFDIISSHINLHSNSKGSLRLTSNIGGFLSIIFLILVFSCSIFFIQEFFQYSKPNVFMSENNKVNITFSNFNKLVFGVRITDEYGNNYKNEDTLFRYQYSWVTTERKNNSISQVYNNLNTTQCQIDKFNTSNKDEKELVSNFKMLNSFTCVDWDYNPNLPYDLFGIYGDQNNLYSISVFLIFQCVNTTENNNKCASIEEIDSKLGNAYVEYFSIDNFIIHENKNPIDKQISTIRLSISNMNNKRIWFSLSQFEYVTDLGLIFENKNKVDFHNLVLYKEESRVINKDLINNGKDFFAIFSFQNNPILKNYSRTYIKVQDLISNIGGIIEGLYIFIYLFLFLIGNKLSKINIFNHLPIIEKSNIIKVMNLYKNNLNKRSSIISSSKVNICNNYNTNMFFNENNIKENSLKLTKKMKSKIKLKWYDFLFCGKSCFSTFNYKIYNYYSNILINLLSVETLFSSIYKSDLLSKFVLSDEEYKLIEFLSKSTKNLNADYCTMMMSISSENINKKIVDELNNVINIE